MNRKQLLITSLVQCIASFLLLFLVMEVRADDYSNDFDFEMTRRYDEGTMYNRTDHHIRTDSYYYNPNGLHEVIENQRLRKLIKMKYVEEKFRYKPLSPNKRQHRKMTNTTVIEDD